MRFLWLFFVPAALMLGAIDGTVINKTTGQPAANVPITLVKPGQGGMKTLGTTVSDASGTSPLQTTSPVVARNCFKPHSKESITTSF